MRDTELLLTLLASETESEAIKVLEARGLLEDKSRWRYLGNMPNNQSIVQNQQSTPAAALVEKFTNGLDAILLRHCKARRVDPRGAAAPRSMGKAVERFIGDTAALSTAQGGELAGRNMV